MKLSCAILLLAASMVKSVAQELPITTTDVFIQSGEVSESSVNVMTRCNSELASNVVLSIDGDVSKEGQVTGETDFTITFKVDGLDSNTKYEYSVECTPTETSADVPTARQAPTTSMTGSFKTTPAADDAAAVKFVWAADLAGQGWGRNPDFEVVTTDGQTIKGGYVVFEMMKSLQPEFALFQGDMIYADGAIPPVKEIPTGGNWTNNPSKDFVAVTLEEFRDNWKYNYGDEKMQSFLAEVPQFPQWDDHEVTNNWWPDEVLGPALYEEGTPANTLFENSLKAFYEFNPIQEGDLIYRKQRFGKHLEIFFPDYRSYRDPNPENEGEDPSAMMGEEQLQWLKDGLASSTATWKIISSHDPFGIVTGGEGDRDSFGNELPEILGREHELKDLLGFIHDNDITGVVSLTSDVHFTAHVNMDPERAEGGFTDFNPLDEFVIGPIHAGSFGPNFMDTSFGAQYEYELGPLTLGFDRWANLPPSHFELQSFGHASIGEDGTLEIKLIGIDGAVKLAKTLEAPAAKPAVTVDDSEEAEANVTKACLDQTAPIEADDAVKEAWTAVEDLMLASCDDGEGCDEEKTGSEIVWSYDFGSIGGSNESKAYDEACSEVQGGKAVVYTHTDDIQVSCRAESQSHIRYIVALAGYFQCAGMSCEGNDIPMVEAVDFATKAIDKNQKGVTCELGDTSGGASMFGATRVVSVITTATALFSLL